MKYACDPPIPVTAGCLYRLTVTGYFLRPPDRQHRLRRMLLASTERQPMGGHRRHFFYKTRSVSGLLRVQQ